MKGATVTMSKAGEKRGNDVLTIAAVQAPLRADNTTPLESAKIAEQLIRDTAAANPPKDGSRDTDCCYDGMKRSVRKTDVDIFVLPELSPIGYSEHTFANFLSPSSSVETESDSCHSQQDDIVRLFAQVARDWKVFICFGVIGTSSTSNGSVPRTSSAKEDCCETKPRIRQLVLNPLGQQIAQYDKIHLCDYGDCDETRFFESAGAISIHKLCSFHCRGFQLGIIICADIRNPTLCRTLASHTKHRVDVILQPAAFSRDISFRTWKSFRETRAVENSVYFVGVNYAGEHYGETSFCEPWIDKDHEPQVMGIDVGVLVGKVYRGVINDVRQKLPYYRQLCSDGEMEH